TPAWSPRAMAPSSRRRCPTCGRQLIAKLRSRPCAASPAGLDQLVLHASAGPSTPNLADLGILWHACAMEHTYDFDLAVIGSGPGGQKAAIMAAKLGHKVCIIDSKSMV